MLLNYVNFQDFTREQARYAFEIADTNGDNMIDVAEFIQLMFPEAKELVINIRYMSGKSREFVTQFYSGERVQRFKTPLISKASSSFSLF